MGRRSERRSAQAWAAISRSREDGEMGIGVLTALASVIGAALVGIGISRMRARRQDRQAPRIRRERRVQSRIIPTPDMPAKLQIIGDESTAVPEIKDVSTTGLAISVPDRFNGKPPDKEVEVVLKLHGEGTVRAR